MMEGSRPPEPNGDQADPTEPPARGRLSPWAWRHAIPVTLAVLVVLAFMPALDAGFVNWDDDRLLLQHTQHHVLSGENITWMFSTSYAGHFQPLTWLSYAVDYALWEGDPFGYHLTSVLLHLVAAVLFYYLARALIVAGCAGGAVDLRCRDVALAGGLAAVLFAVHPLRAESVAWLAERRDVLSAVWLLVAILCYLRYASTRESVESERPRWGWYVAAVLTLAVSLLAKASGMTLFAVLLILDVYPLRRLRLGRGLFGPGCGRVWLEKVPFLALGIAAGMRALVAQQAGGMVQTLVDHDLPARFAQACYGLTFYIGKTLVPVSLGPIYQIPPRDELLGFMFYGSLFVLAALAFVAWRFRNRVPGFAAALLAYAVMVAPVLGFVQSGPQLVADRYSYLSCMGFAVLGGAGLLWLMRFTSLRSVRHSAKALGLGAAAIVAGLTHTTLAQADIWLMPRTLWGHGVRVSPGSSVAHVNYADALALDADYADALEHYDAGLAIDPNDAIAHQHRAQILRIGRANDAAIEGFRQALRLDPTRPGARKDLAELLISRGDLAEAVSLLRAGVVENPTEAGALDLFSQLLSTHPDDTVRNGPEAVEVALLAVRLRGNGHPAALLTLATAYAEAGRFDEAITAAAKAVPMAKRAGDIPLANELERRAALFRAGKPYHYGSE